MHDEHDYTQATLIKELHASLPALLEQLDRFSDAQMLGPTDAAGWTVRDHLTHLAVWAEGIVALLRGESRWTAMGLELQDSADTRPDYDHLNEIIAQAHRHVTPSDARAWLIKAHANVVESVSKLQDADLVKPYGAFSTPKLAALDGPIADYVYGNTVDHYAEHLPWMLAIVEPAATESGG